MIVNTVSEAKASLSELIDRASEGEEVIICRAGRPVAVLRPYRKAERPREPGALRGKIHIAPDFRLDLRTGELFKEDRTVRLPPQPTKLLLLLVRSPGALVTHDEIHKAPQLVTENRRALFTSREGPLRVICERLVHR